MGISQAVLQFATHIKNAVGRGHPTLPKKPYHIAYSKFVMYVPLFVGGGVPDAPDGRKKYRTFVGNYAVGRPALWPPRALIY